MSNWGGRIGVILGVILTIHGIATGMDILNGLFIGLFSIILLGFGGFVIGAIVNLIIKNVKK